MKQSNTPPDTAAPRKRIRMTKAQRVWCKQYEDLSGFDPLMDDFKAGNETFVAAARKSMFWLQDVVDELHCIKIPGDDV